MELRHRATDAPWTNYAVALFCVIVAVQHGCASQANRNQFAAPLPNSLPPADPAGFAPSQTQPVRTGQRLRQHVQQTLHRRRPQTPGDPVMAAIEGHYQQAIAFETQFKPQCLYHYYQAATLGWPRIQSEFVVEVTDRSRAWEIYHSSVGKLVSLAPKYGRFDPNQGISLAAPSGNMLVVASYNGFPWFPEDFQKFALVGEPQRDSLTNYHRFEGVGVPLIVQGTRVPKPLFMRESHTFAATALLQPMPTGEWTIAFYDPVRVRRISVGNESVPIVRDLTAPFAAGIGESDRNYLQGLLRPDDPADRPELLMIEPFQPGRIPVVFVHGLASDRFTWADMANDLRTEEQVMDRYQIMAFQYPTGRPFLESASELRRQLKLLRQAANPNGQDIAFDQMVIVGHSLGGLVAKLQVTYSEDKLWKSIAYEPFSQVNLEPQQRNKLGSSAFFDPVPSVRRVVYIATPHLGSSYAQQFIGRFTSSLVRPDTADVEAHRRMIEDNPGVFSNQIRRRIPNSVDLLEPENRVLLAIYQLRYSPQVQYHSIIGTGYQMKGGEGDKVVLIKSAEQPGAASQKLVVAKHQEVHRKPASAAELTRILMENLSSSPIVAPPSPAPPDIAPIRLAPPDPNLQPPIMTGFRLLDGVQRPSTQAELHAW